MNERPTPETDAAAASLYEHRHDSVGVLTMEERSRQSQFVTANLARRLEQQRDELLEALQNLLRRDQINTCQHEETHRGGSLWEICERCGQKWADDEGGKPEFLEPKEWTAASAAIAAVKGNQ